MEAIGEPEIAEPCSQCIAPRFADCGLELHPQKTKIVYCKDDDRRGTCPERKFDFLGDTFRPRRSRNRFGKCFVNFTQAVSNKAASGTGWWRKALSYQAAEAMTLAWFRAQALARQVSGVTHRMKPPW